VSDVEHFVPDPDLLAELKQRGREATGHDFLDCRWHPEESCLAIYERHRMHPPGHPGTVRTFLVDENNEPRQLRRSDIEDIVNMVYGRRKVVDEWRKRWEAEQEAARLAAQEERHERSLETAKEMVRVANYGVRPYVLLGETDEVSEPSVAKTTLSNGETLFVQDRRRIVGDE